MTLIVFIIVLGILVLVHEMGHFVAAKKAGVRVDEFGFGYPPRAVTLGEKWGTKFSINWIPFGGFVKIFGENPVEEAGPSDGASYGRKFSDVNRGWQAIILVAGVTFNILFAWILLSLGFFIGLPASVDNQFDLPVQNPELTVISVVPDSPSQTSGLKSGDKILSISNQETHIKSPNPSELSDFIDLSNGPIELEIKRGSADLNISVNPEEGLVEGRKAIGINMDLVGTLSLPLHKALYEGVKTTLDLLFLTVMGIFDLIIGAFHGTADLSQVTGPVGIVGLVGDATRLGFTYLLTFTALISINLAIINLIPFPALDGGRLVFVGIEAIKKSPINPRIAMVLNTLGFALLIILMIVITARDIANLF